MNDINGAPGLRMSSENSVTPLRTAGYSSEVNRNPTTVTLADGSRVTISPIGQNASLGSQSQVGYTPNVAYSQAPETQPTSSSGSSGSGMSIASGVFDSVAKVYNDLRQNQAAKEATSNSIFNRNLNRKNFALNAANTASNLATAGQNRMQAGITFGQGQEDRQAQLKMAAAAAKGISEGLLGIQGV